MTVVEKLRAQIQPATDSVSVFIRSQFPPAPSPRRSFSFGISFGACLVNQRVKLVTANCCFEMSRTEKMFKKVDNIEPCKKSYLPSEYFYDHAVTNLVGVLFSAHHQMSLSPHLHTLTVALHPRLHSPSAIALLPHPIRDSIKAPVLPLANHGFFLVPVFLLVAWTFVYDSSPPAYWTLALVIGLFSLGSPLWIILHVDPLASRLVHPVTEQSVTTGSSSFTPGQSSDMDTDRTLYRIKQGQRTLDQHIREFLAIANYSTLPDSSIMEIFCDCINEPLKAKLRREGPRSSLAAFLNFALLCVGSPCTVGVAKGERDNADTAAPHPARRLVVTPDHDTKTKFSAWIAREMAAVSERVHTMAVTTEPVHKMATKTELRHVTAAIPEPYSVAAAFPESSRVSKSSQGTAAFPESSQVAAVFPESSRVSKSSQGTAAFPESSQVSKSSQVADVFPEPLHKMAAVSKQLHKMAAVSRPPHNMATITEPEVSTQMPPVVMMAHVLDTPLVTVWAAKMVLLHAAAATPESSQDTESGQVTAVLHESSHVTAVVPESSPVVPESSHVTAVVPESSHVVQESSPVTADPHELSQAAAVFPEPSQASAAAPESSQATAVAPKSSQAPKSSDAKAAVPESSHVTADFHESSPVTAGRHKPSQVTADLHEPSQFTTDLHEAGQVTVGHHEPSHILPDGSEPHHASSDRSESSQASSDPPEPRHILSICLEPHHVSFDRSESSHVPPDGPEPLHVSSDLPVPRHVSSIRPEPSHVSSDLPEPCHASSDIPRSRPIMIAGVLDPPQPPAAALPLMAVAIWCVWAAHCAPEATSGLQPAPELLSDLKPAAELSSGLQPDPELPSDLKPAPESLSDLKPAAELSSGLQPAPELPSDLKPAAELSSGLQPDPELPSDHKPASEVPSGLKSAPEAFPIGEAAPMPPEVSAPAVEPLMEGALSAKLSASPFFLSAPSLTVLPRSQSMTQPPVPPRRAAAPPVPPRRAAAPPVPPRRAAAPTPPIPSASSVPALPRSQTVTQIPVSPWRAPAPPPPWRAPAPPALPPAPPWRAPAPPAPPWKAPAPPWRAPAPPAPPWRAPAPPAPPWRAPAPPAPPWRAPAPPAPPWRAPAPPAPPPAPPWRVPVPPAPPWKASSLPVLPQSPGPPTTPLDCFFCCFCWSVWKPLLGGGLCHESGRCPVLRSPPDVTLTSLTHSDCCTTPQTTFPISHCSSPASNQRQYKSPGPPTCKPRIVGLDCFVLLAFPSFLVPVFLLVAWTFVYDSSLACLLDSCSGYWTILSRIAPMDNVRYCFDPACLTMYLSHPSNKSLHVDPLASRLVHPVTHALIDHRDVCTGIPV
ncbi:hypothetical protein M9458_054546 [Cirrhinus mrigala]|uniref:Uncharacterized protein n=1 Tax=Cirrhinus mrigala TaxID=683832 RepID=A0ABD0MIX2_CIRMR